MRVRGTLLISLQELGMIAGWKLFPLPCLRVGGGLDIRCGQVVAGSRIGCFFAQQDKG
jgi:hypothetical protein